MNVGGIERGVIDIVKFFKKKDIANIVVSGGGRLVKELEAEKIKHYKLAVYKKSIASLFIIPALRRIIEKESIDIVHARSRVPAWIGFFATRFSRANFITTAHGVYKNKFFSKVMGWGKYVICPSTVVARHMKKNFDVPEEKIVIIKRWVDLDKFKFINYEKRKKSNIIVSIGRISSSKGYEYLIKAFKKVIRINPYFKLKIVGSPDKSKVKYFESLKTLVNRYALNYNVEFVGFRQDVENILSTARILVAPSVIEESFGRVVIEAFASGVPVVATEVGGFKEIIEHEKDGILVEPKNSEQIADSISKILEDSNLAKNMTDRARKKVEKYYTMEECLQETEKVYHKTLESLRILVIKTSSLGDLILSLPALSELRYRFPKAQIKLLTSKKLQSFVYDCPYVNEIIAVDDKQRKIKNIFKIAKDLRCQSFDYIIDLQNNRFSHLVSFLSIPRHSFGYALRWGFLLSKKIRYDRSLRPLDSQERILNLLGIKFREKKLIFWERKTEIPYSLPDNQLIGINISASKKWQSKNWPLENLTKLIDLINKNLTDFRIVLIGDKYSQSYAQKIESLYPNCLTNLCGKSTFHDLPQLLNKLSLLLTPDTATLHLAVALGIPTIALFGPTDPERHTVKSNNLYVFVEKITCSFCYKPQCKLKEKNLCLKNISPATVFSKIKEILKQ
jgi:ADP-heptose:LPS heptosyltransferase